MRVDASPATARGSMAGDHCTTAWPMTSMPRRPARPVSWVYWPGVRSTWLSPSNFTSFSSTTLRAGMLMPRARVSVAKTARSSPWTKSFSTMWRNAGSMPAWWAAKPRFRAAFHWENCSTSRSSSGMPATPSSMIASMRSDSSWLVRTRLERRHWKSAPSHPAREKMKVMAGSIFMLCSTRMTSGRPTGR